MKEFITDRIDDIKAFLAYPKQVLVKPKNWSDLDEEDQKDWKSHRLTFALSLTAMIGSLIALIVSISRFYNR